MRQMLIGESPQIKDVYERIEKAALVNLPVLIVGETGTGKELTAAELHARGRDANAPFVALNTGALSSELLYSELFGHVKGAFTGATEANAGRFAEADQGTLFLDEISSADQRAQVALLRVLEEGCYRPLGGANDKDCKVRIIAATNVSPDDAIESGVIRADLMYRLNVLCIELPTLRSRRDDISLLVDHLLESIGPEIHREPSGVTADAMDALEEYAWPGNVRELRNVVYQGAVLAEDKRIDIRHLPLRVGNSDNQGVEDANSSPQYGMRFPVGATLADVSSDYVQRTLLFCGNNKTKAAEMLGISRRTLYTKLNR